MWELIVGIGVPAFAGIVAVTKYIIDMKAKIRELSKHDESSVDIHSEYDERLKIIEENQIKWIIYLKLLLKDRNIDFSD